MASCVHYMFKSSTNYDTISFDGLSISNAELKSMIITQKKLGRSLEFDLLLTNAQTKEAYGNDDDMIPKNSSVVVTRVPISKVAKQKACLYTCKEDFRKETSELVVAYQKHKGELPPSGDSAVQEPMSLDQLVKTSDLASANAPEDLKLKAMMIQSTKDYDPNNYVRPSKGIPKSYLCHICKTSGHLIKDCPKKGDPKVDRGYIGTRVRRNHGIPKSFMMPVSGPNVQGAMMTTEGHYAVPTINAEAYIKGKKERPPFVPPSAEEQAKAESEKAEPKKIIPPELSCPVCHDLIKDAVLVKCCTNSGCDECIRNGRMDSEDNRCPICSEPDLKLDQIIINKFLRGVCLRFDRDNNYTSSVTKIQEKLKPQPAPSPPPEPQPSQPTIPNDLIGMPPQVIKAYLDNKRKLAEGSPAQQIPPQPPHSPSPPRHRLHRRRSRSRSPYHRYSPSPLRGGHRSNTPSEAHPQAPPQPQPQQAPVPQQSLPQPNLPQPSPLFMQAAMLGMNLMQNMAASGNIPPPMGPPNMVGPHNMPPTFMHMPSNGTVPGPPPLMVGPPSGPLPNFHRDGPREAPPHSRHPNDSLEYQMEAFIKNSSASAIPPRSSPARSWTSGSISSSTGSSSSSRGRRMSGSPEGRPVSPSAQRRKSSRSPGRRRYSRSYSRRRYSRSHSRRRSLSHRRMSATPPRRSPRRSPGKDARGPPPPNRPGQRSYSRSVLPCPRKRSHSPNWSSQPVKRQRTRSRSPRARWTSSTQHTSIHA